MPDTSYESLNVHAEQYLSAARMHASKSNQPAEVMLSMLHAQELATLGVPNHSVAMAIKIDRRVDPETGRPQYSVIERCINPAYTGSRKLINVVHDVMQGFRKGAWENAPIPQDGIVRNEYPGPPLPPPSDPAPPGHLIRVRPLGGGRETLLMLAPFPHTVPVPQLPQHAATPSGSTTPASQAQSIPPSPSPRQRIARTVSLPTLRPSSPNLTRRHSTHGPKRSG